MSSVIMNRFWFPTVILLNNTALFPLNSSFLQRLVSFFMLSTVTTWKKQLQRARVCVCLEFKREIRLCLGSAPSCSLYRSDAVIFVDIINTSVVSS